MQLQAKNNKGFTILEVIVVLCLVGIISAIAYPNIDTWNKTRKVKTEVLRAVNIFENINSQVQRGLYTFAQVYISSEVLDDASSKVAIISRGMSADSFGRKMSETPDLFKDPVDRCFLDGDEWDDDGSVSKKPEVSSVVLEGIETPEFIGEAAVCFSKDGKYYGGTANFADLNNFMIRGTGGICDDPDDIKGPECDYRIGWSRFGSIKLEKWNDRAGVDNDGDWVNQLK